MSTPQPAPATPSSLKIGLRERMAMEEIALTTIRKSHAVVFITLFLGFLYGVFLWDLPVTRSLPILAGNHDAAPAPPASAIRTSSMLPEWTNPIFAENRRVLDRIKASERQVDERSPFVRMTQPGVQEVLAACGEGGTEVMAGKDGWLFYRPSFRFLTRPAEDLAEAQVLSARYNPAKAAGYRASLEPITRFAAALNERGIRLVMMPVWPKQSIQPENLGGSAYRSAAALKPEGFAAWRDAIERAGVLVFDPADSLMAAKKTHNGIAYLKTDSHWNPQTMHLCAADLARFLSDRGLVAPGTVKATMVPSKVTNPGDLARMLQMPAGSRRFPAEQIDISEVRGDKGIRWLTSRASPVLLLGDSYSNIFSLASMGWGQDAGFAEHLGAALAMPVDAILRNGDGESATRGLLAHELATGKDRLAGKKVVVWEFSATQITEGHWLPFSYALGSPPAADGQFVELGDEETRQVTATIAEMGLVPHPSATVYKEYVGYFVLEDLRPLAGPALTGHKALVFGVVMMNHLWTPAANLRPGQHIKANLRSWSSAEEEFGRHQRCEPSADLIMQPPNWLADFTLED